MITRTGRLITRCPRTTAWAGETVDSDDLSIPLAFLIAARRSRLCASSVSQLASVGASLGRDSMPPRLMIKAKLAPHRSGRVAFAVYVIGIISGVVFHSSTSGAADRGRIAVLESDLQSRNDKLDKCTDALINGLRPNAPQPAAPPTATSPK